MIFVVLGTQKFQFCRLLKMIDEAIENGTIQEEVIAQIGHTKYCSKNFRTLDFVSQDEFDGLIKECNVLVTHSGVATIIKGLNYKKPIIVVPRMEKYNEHVDDHQFQIAYSFAFEKFVLMYDENDDMGKLIQKAKSFKFKRYHSQRTLVLDSIQEFIEAM